jgi:hypothetical protein
LSDDNVIPFRKRPPSDTELEVYRQITRAWHADVKAMLFPDHFRHDQEKRQSSDP